MCVCVCVTVCEHTVHCSFTALCSVTKMPRRDAVARFRKASLAVRFANRLATMRETKDRETVAAVRDLGSVLGEDVLDAGTGTGMDAARAGAGAGVGAGAAHTGLNVHTGARPGFPMRSPTAASRCRCLSRAVTRLLPLHSLTPSLRRRLVMEERSAKMEDAGIFERRLGLKQRSRARMMHAKSSSLGRSKLTEVLVSPTSSEGVEYHHTTPLPPRRTVGGSQALAQLRSPLSSERKLSEDSDSESTASGVSDRPRVFDPLGRRRPGSARRGTATGGVAAWGGRRGTGGRSLGDAVGVSDTPPRVPGAAPARSSGSTASRAKAKAQRVMNAVMFANRLSGTAASKDRATMEAAASAGSGALDRVLGGSRGGAAGAGAAGGRGRGRGGPRVHTGFSRLRDEEAAAKMEDAGVFESRLHLREQLHHGARVAPSHRAGTSKSPSPLHRDSKGKSQAKTAAMGHDLLKQLHRH